MKKILLYDTESQADVDTATIGNESNWQKCFKIVINTKVVIHDGAHSASQLLLRGRVNNFSIDQVHFFLLIEFRCTFSFLIKYYYIMFIIIVFR